MRLAYCLTGTCPLLRFDRRCCWSWQLMSKSCVAQPMTGPGDHLCSTCCILTRFNQQKGRHAALPQMDRRKSAFVILAILSGRSCGLMDKVFASEAKDCRFESCLGHFC